MSFQQSVHVNLQDEKLIEFVVTHAVKQGFPKNPTAPAGFTLKAQREVGKSRSAVNWSRLVDCAVYQNRARPTVVARKEIMCLASKPVTIELQAHLLLHSSADAGQQAQIIDAFNSFDQTTDGDPSGYISDRLKANPTITRGMFRVDLGYTIWIDGDVRLDDLPVTRFLEYWDGQYPGNVVVTRPKPGMPNERESIGEQLQKSEMWAERIGYRDVYAVIPSVPNRDIIETTDPQETANERAKEELNRGDCNRTKTDVHEVAELTRWYETKVDWKEVRIDLGCGNWMSLYVPAFQSREVAYILFASVTTPEQAGDDIERAVMNCFWASVLASTVVLVALMDPSRALVAFKALFLECIIRKFETALACVTVDLFIATRVINDWH